MAGPELRKRLREAGIRAEERGGRLEVSISAKTPEEALERLKALGPLLAPRG